MKQIIKTSFWQLIFIYSLIVLVVALGFISKYSLQLNILAIIVGLIGAFVLKEKNTKINKKANYFILSLGLFLIFLIRILPYFFTDIPLGYDPGIYKYGIENGLKNKDRWILEGGMEPGFLYLMQPFKLFFSTDFILKYIFILFCVFLGFSLYLAAKEYFNEKTAIISVFVYAFSLVQFRTFWFLYFKNVIGLSTMLLSLYFLKKAEKRQDLLNRILFVVFGSLTGAIHRPTFYIFGLSYFFYAFFSPYEKRKYNLKVLKINIISGVLILMFFLLFYLGDFFPAIMKTLPWIAAGFVDPGQSPGTFINFFTYQYSILPYFVFAVLGFAICLKRKLNILSIWAIINFAIVYFQFFFFNRFIIMLDIVLMLFSSFGLSILLDEKDKKGKIVFFIIILSMLIFSLKESSNAKPLLDNDELETIKYFSETPENSFAMSTSSYYSTWIIGYSERKTIAPGLFDYDKHSKKEWERFWEGKNLDYTKSFLNSYEKPLYIFIGKRQKDFLEKFNGGECFKIFKEKNGNKIYEYLC